MVRRISIIAQNGRTFWAASLYIHPKYKKKRPGRPIIMCYGFPGLVFKTKWEIYRERKREGEVGKGEKDGNVKVDHFSGRRVGPFSPETEAPLKVTSIILLFLQLAINHLVVRLSS